MNRGLFKTQIIQYEYDNIATSTTIKYFILYQKEHQQKEMEKSNKSLMTNDQIKNQILINKPDINEKTLQRYTLLISQLFFELSQKQILQNVNIIEQTDICKKNIKSLRLYYQACLSYFGNDRFSENDQKFIQERMNQLNTRYQKQVEQQDISDIGVDNKQIQDLMETIAKNAIKRLNNIKQINRTSDLQKYILLDLLLRYNQRIGVFEKMLLLDLNEYKIKDGSIYDKNEIQQPNDYNYCLVNQSEIHLVINKFKTQNFYKQINITIIPKNDLDKRLIEFVNLLKQSGNRYVHSTRNKNNEESIVSVNSIATKVVKWFKNENLNINPTKLNKIGMNNAIRQDPTNAREIANNRGSNIDTIINNYIKKDYQNAQ